MEYCVCAVRIISRLISKHKEETTSIHPHNSTTIDIVDIKRSSFSEQSKKVIGIRINKAKNECVCVSIKKKKKFHKILISHFNAYNVNIFGVSFIWICRTLKQEKMMARISLVLTRNSVYRGRIHAYDMWCVSVSVEKKYWNYDDHERTVEFQMRLMTDNTDPCRNRIVISVCVCVRACAGIFSTNVCESNLNL